MSRGLFSAAVILAALELVAFGPLAPKLGFYHDDWAILERLSGGGGFWGAVGAMARGGFWIRPVEIIQFPVFFSLAGHNPLAHQALLMAFDALAAFLLFVLLERLWQRPGLALTAAALALLYPNHGSSHHWFALSSQPVALCLVLASMLCFVTWREGSRRGWLAATLLFYAAGALCYESPAFLPLLLVDWLWRQAGGRAAKRSGEVALALAPYGLALAAIVLWQRWGVPGLVGESNPKAMAFSLERALDVFGKGLQCVTTRAAWLSASTLRFALNDFGWGMAVLWTAGVGGTVAALHWFGRQDQRGGAEAALKTGVAGFIGAYLPYTVSVYTPAILGVANRVNSGGGLAGGILCASLLSALGRGRPRARLAATAVLAGAFLWTNWEVTLQWQRSWETQGAIIRRLEPHLKRVPPGATVVLSKAPHFHNGVPIFAAGWDFGPALRYLTGRRDLHGDVLTPLRVLSGGDVVERDDAGRLGAVVHRNPYIYRFDRDELVAPHE